MVYPSIHKTYTRVIQYNTLSTERKNKNKTNNFPSEHSTHRTQRII